MDKKRFYPLFAIFMAGLMLFSACTTKSGGNTVTKITAFVGFGAGSDPDSMAALNTIAGEFNASHKDIQMEFMFSTWEEHTSKFSALLAGDLTPDLAFPIGIQGIAEFYDEWIDVSSYINQEITIPVTSTVHLWSCLNSMTRPLVCRWAYTRL
jgi:ABC-type glycerol-3-phosphate transport system substrate-binding protein